MKRLECMFCGEVHVSYFLEPEDRIIAALCSECMQDSDKYAALERATLDATELDS